MPVFYGEDLAPGARIEGPAVIEEPTTTIVVYPAMTARVGGSNSYRLEPLADAGALQAADTDGDLDPVTVAVMANRLDGITPGTRAALFAVLLVAFGIKAAVFPLSTWLPDSYPTAPAPITAVFAGLLTKVGVYAIIRAHSLLFPGGALDNVLMVAGVLTMIIGILGAMAQSDIKRLLSFTLVSHIGYMVFGVALSSRLGMSGAIYYVAHHIIVQTTLFLVVGLIERQAGAWWTKHVVNREPLPEGSAPPSMDTLKRIQREPATVLNLTGDAEAAAIVSAWTFSTERRKQAELDEETAKARAVALLGSAEAARVTIDGETKLLKCQEQSFGRRVDGTKLKAEMPEVFEKYAVESRGVVPRLVKAK